MIPEETAMYQYCKLILQEYKAWEKHDYNAEAEKLHKDTLNKLKMTAIDFADGYRSFAFVIEDTKDEEVAEEESDG